MADASNSLEPASDKSPNRDKRDELIVSIWVKAVDTQMHFNEMSVKSRQLGLTFVAAALGLAIFLFSRGLMFNLASTSAKG